MTRFSVQERGRCGVSSADPGCLLRTPFVFLGLEDDLVTAERVPAQPGMDAPIGGSDLASHSVRELLLELDRVEQMIRSVDLYRGGNRVNPDLVALAEREQAITAELAHRHTTFDEWFAYGAIDGRQR